MLVFSSVAMAPNGHWYADVSLRCSYMFDWQAMKERKSVKMKVRPHLLYQVWSLRSDCCVVSSQNITIFVVFFCLVPLWEVLADRISQRTLKTISSLSRCLLFTSTEFDFFVVFVFCALTVRTIAGVGRHNNRNVLIWTVLCSHWMPRPIPFLIRWQHTSCLIGWWMCAKATQCHLVSEAPSLAFHQVGIFHCSTQFLSAALTV